MKQFKLTLVLTVLMSMVGLQAFADWDTSTKVENNGIYYYLDNDNLQAQVTSMPSGKYAGDIEIPFDFIYAGNIYSVTSIGESAFAYCSDLSSVTIGNSVTSIGGSAFNGCSGLTSVTIGNGVTSIGAGAFYGCRGLTSISIPNSVTSIRAVAFYGCTGLTSVTIPNSVTSIGGSAFSLCSDLASIIVELGNTIYDSRNNCNAIIETASNKLVAGCKNTVIPNSVTSIGDYAFRDCSGLTSVTIPNSVTSIGDRAFYWCSKLTSVTLNSNDIVSKEHTYSDNIKTIFGEQVKEYVIGDDVTAIGDNAFYGCSKLTSVAIGNNVTSIGYMTFYGCTDLTSITIPDKVTTIGAYAFRDCSGLESVTIGSGVTSYGNSAFQCSNLTFVTVLNPTPVAITPNVFTNRTNAMLYVPKGSKDAYKAADYWKEFKGIIDRIEFADANVKAICVEHWDTNGDGELNYDEAAAVTTVSDFFKGNTSITSFDEFAYFTGVTSIGNHAFDDCSGLTSIIIPNSVTSIGDYAFSDCGLTSVTIPNSVTSIGAFAFQSCSGLTSVTIPNSVTSIGDRAFSDCPSLTSMVVESGNPKYDSRNNCNAIIETASNTLVAGCKATIIPNSVTNIGNRAFERCSALTSIDIPYGVTSIGFGAFDFCSALTSVTIPNSVTSIGAFAFDLCSALTSVTIPNSVTSIGDFAFWGCSKLTSVTALNPTPVAITQNVFTNRTNATLYVPKGSKDAYKAADYWKEFKEIIEIDPTGIDQISFQENGEQGIDEEGAVWYTIDGKQIDKPKKGINIIRMNNGTTKKVVVK